VSILMLGNLAGSGALPHRMAAGAAAGHAPVAPERFWRPAAPMLLALGGGMVLRHTPRARVTVSEPDLEPLAALPGAQAPD